MSNVNIGEDLFGNAKRKIRTLGFYQPFGSLMLWGKVETRWVMSGKKPPFPLGEYLFYTTKKECSNADLYSWCRNDVILNISELLINDPTRLLNGFAIGIGELHKVELLKPEEEKLAFVKWVGRKKEIIMDREIIKDQWGLHFKNVQRIEPFEYNFGKQGIGFLPESEFAKVNVTNKIKDL